MIAVEKKDIKGLQKSGEILSESLRLVAKAAIPGKSTLELDRLAREAIAARGGAPAFLGYRGYPAALCTSLNARVVHGIPHADEVLKEGDIVGLDLGVNWGGYFTDMAVTVPVGAVSSAARDLIDATENALRAGLNVLKADITTGDLGAAIEAFVKKRGYSVVRDFVGHGVGAQVHEDPQIPNFGLGGHGQRIPEGSVIAIEPMVNRGRPGVRILEDGWTVETADQSLSAHFERTVRVTVDGYEEITPAFP
jgi:methionyl aminopeptidase